LHRSAKSVPDIEIARLIDSDSNWVKQARSNYGMRLLFAGKIFSDVRTANIGHPKVTGAVDRAKAWCIDPVRDDCRWRRFP
jgi:hypothetical protein